ncbi:ImmA/IrrE family metallo-endopeptidase [Ereboglobus sp. PH5-5]|uniref:ImmA/IrrE family metallo-endopeptidase n=1 Tax=Ereboglobus sp. PH5-5 TaxID=2940529 RepID=UPI002407190C|nr:ImmA/IrrE family metallo-endopeptidase [Ereboglobus sp. PH5-5]
MNASVVALMKHKAQPNEIPQETIRRLARTMVADAKTQGWNEVPFDPELLAELHGIEVRCANEDIKAEARLMPLPDCRLQIEYASDAPETRRRFSICHEIAHTFFPDCFEQVQHRRQAQNHDRIHAELEQLCHVGAGELLMPVDEFTVAIAERPPDMSVASEIAQQFNASHEAALRRMVDLTDTVCCLIWLSERLKPAQQKNAGPELDLGLPGPLPKLRVDYQFGSQKWRNFIPPHKSIPDTSKLYTFFSGIGEANMTEDWSELKLGNLQIQAVKSIHAEPESKGLMVLLCQ